MDVAKVAKLCENLSIADEDGAIHEITEDAQREGFEDVYHCLVGKVLSGGAGDISKLGFNRVEMWVQIHNIPIMCMNRKTAKWLAEQIGVVVMEIPANSKECWGTFMRVKVRIGISRPLKWWLRLKLDKSEDIVVVTLKYERLPEFCFGCGKIGHGLRECIDDTARTEALEGSGIRFSAWLRAPTMDRQKPRSHSQENGDSSRRGRLSEGSLEAFKTSALSLKTRSLSSKGDALIGKEGSGDSITKRGGKGKEILVGPTSTASIEKEPDTFLKDVLGCDGDIATIGDGVTPIIQDQGNTSELPKKKNTMRWKRTAKEGQVQLILGKVSSPLQKLLSIIHSVRKPAKKNSPSTKANPIGHKNCPTNTRSTCSVATNDHVPPPFSSSFSLGGGDLRPAESDYRCLLESPGEGKASGVRSHKKAAEKVFSGFGLFVRNKALAWGTGLIPRPFCGVLERSIVCLGYVVCGSKLLGWSKERFGSLRKLISEKQREIERLYRRSWDEGIMSLIKNLERDLECILAREEEKEKSIFSLLDDNGRIQDIEAGLARAVSEYFSSIYKSSNPSDPDLRLAIDAIGSRLSSDMVEGLRGRFLAEEIKTAIFEMGPRKAPDPDGLNGQSSISEFNGTNVVLIPKVKNPASLKDFRLISLCNVVYKTLSKVLANLLKAFLPTIISHFQSAFIPGRLIFDNVLTSFEILHSIANKKTGKTGLMAPKTRHEQGNFFSFLLNGRKVCTVKPSRGLRQGCPLSHYLFLLYAEALSGLISASEKNGRGIGVRCCKGSPFIIHIFFADDSLLFCRASKDNGNLIRQILGVCERGLGQRVNLQKSRITFSPNVAVAVRSDIQEVFAIEDCNTNDSYLGMPSLVGRNKRLTFNVIKERAWKRVCCWKGNLISTGGIEILIKAMAQTIPTYVMSIFQLPKGLCRDLNAMMSKFWWGSK
ncbi:hypothetical protein Dsin_030873 [Dipteronia sinensis]|uniref:CCHC-type domain-containing protein n=1 Tax=Dipteronia sinensis TaxID=43782 RepID=A0AAE0DRT8_9ROSI|nr:hypothetical protein Dsin_030873 [Dipteronia sinensis]